MIAAARCALLPWPAILIGAVVVTDGDELGRHAPRITRELHSFTPIGVMSAAEDIFIINTPPNGNVRKALQGAVCSCRRHIDVRANIIGMGTKEHINSWDELVFVKVFFRKSSLCAC